MNRPFTITLKDNEVAMISERDGAFVVEPMRFMWPSEAKAFHSRSEARKRVWREFKEWKASNNGR